VVHTLKVGVTILKLPGCRSYGYPPAAGQFQDGNTHLKLAENVCVARIDSPSLGLAQSGWRHQQ